MATTTIDDIASSHVVLLDDDDDDEDNANANDILPAATNRNSDAQSSTRESISLESFGAYFLADRAIFGAYPTTARLDYLATAHAVDVVVDLTVDDERWCRPYALPPPSVRAMERLRYPIRERSVPRDERSFCRLVVDVASMLKRGSRAYVHCKGGHGRSGILAAALIGYVDRVDAFAAIRETTRAHNTRVDLKPYWRNVGSPQTTEQRAFVVNLLRPLELTRMSSFLALVTNDDDDDDDRDRLVDQLMDTGLGTIRATTQALEDAAQRLSEIRDDALCRPHIGWKRELN